MSEMYPPPQPNDQNVQQPATGVGQNPPPQSGAASQPFYPQQPPVTTPYPPQAPYLQQSSYGYPSYPAGAPVQPMYVRTNLSEYWKNAKNGKRNLSILAVLTVLFFMCGPLASAAQGGGASTGSSSLSTTQSSAQLATGTQPTATPAPTATSTSTESPAQYKASATSVSISDIAKDPNAYKGKTIRFTGVIANFVQDSSGNTAGANVDDPNDFSSVVQIAFTPSFSLAKVNKGDYIEVWGQGMGSFTGANAFGATITEGGVQEVYLHDSTSGYSDTTVTDPSSFAANSSN
ncbi:MAG TPA: hypothetical protein VF812_15965 [Ktedonobacterales bacterium]